MAMNQLRKLVNSYYDAIFDDNENEQQRILDELYSVVYQLIVQWGASHLTELAKLFDEKPANISYEPDDSLVNEVHRDLVEVLEGLKRRISNELNTEALKDISISIATVYALVKKNNYWQVERIIDAEDHIIEEKTERDVMSELATMMNVTITKTWVAVIDAKTCPVCRAMDGTTIPFSEDFVYNDSSITIDSHYSEIAHAHPHCRCKVVYQIERG